MSKIDEAKEPSLLKKEASPRKRVYPDQSKWVHGSKIWLELPNEQRIVVSPQAREVLGFYNVNEEKFVQKMRELLLVCFSDLKQEAGFTFSFHDLCVSKASDPWFDTEDSVSCIRIEIRQCEGRQNE
jgi:hypothetical protein